MEYLHTKRVTRPFVQPILSSNGTWNGNAFAVRSNSVYDGWEAWYAFRGKYVGTEYFHSGQGLPAYVQIYNPNPLKVSAIMVQNRGHDDSFLKDYVISYSDNGIGWSSVTEGTVTNTGIGAQNTITVPSTVGYHKYWMIRAEACTGVYSDYWAASRIEITATEIALETYAIPKKVVSYRKAWTRPTLTSNTTYGTVSSTTIYQQSGRDEQPFKAFDGDLSTDGRYLSSGKSSTINSSWAADITWVLPVKLNFKSFTFFSDGTHYYRFPSKISILGRNSNSEEWETIVEYAVDTATAWKTANYQLVIPVTPKKEYSQILFGMAKGRESDNITGVAEIYISADEEGTPEDYTELRTYYEHRFFVKK